jgi:hypothetical protein
VIVLYAILALCAAALLMYLCRDWEDSTVVLVGVMLGVLLTVIIITIADRQESCTRVVRGEQVLAEIGDC